MNTAPTAVAIPKTKNLTLYSTLITRVREAIRLGRERAEDAVEREKVRTSWEIGRLIHEHILLHKDRANYGEQVIKRLSNDLSLSGRELYYMVEFARSLNLRMCAKLSWGHIQSLLRINDVEKRAIFAERVRKENWSVDKTRREISKLKAAKQITVTEVSAEPPLVAKKGIVGTYRIAKVQGDTRQETGGKGKDGLQIDLGFSCYLDLPEKYKKQLNKEDIVEAVKSSVSLVSRPLPLKKSERSEEALFTYAAAVLEILDGDTLRVEVALGFGFTTVQKLRLRGIDCPEINSREGQEAKKFVERELRTSPRATSDKPRATVIITSTKSDKYDRYLADVWIRNNYLNQKLIDKGLAVRMTE